LIDELQTELAALVEERVDQPAVDTFAEIDAVVRARAASPAGPPSPGSISSGPPTGQRARLTEPWFCCSEPTAAQMAPLAPLG
jgi:hypothetical protein